MLTFVGMKEYLPILKILGRFLLIYLVLLLIYQLYLNFFQETHIVDPITHWMGEHCAVVLNKLGYITYMVPDEARKGDFFYVNQVWATIMVEGCNAISIMILFVSFIFAFYKGLKKTVLFALGGLLLLYVLNIFRIVLLNIIAVDYNEYLKSAHDYLFPAIIYGGVVILWLIWINRFVLRDEASS